MNSKLSEEEFIEKAYNILSSTPSDINEHLPTLNRYATECESILELGVRGCISSWALLNGLLQNNKQSKYLFLNDITHCDIELLLNVTQNGRVEVNYQWINDLDLNLQRNFDLTFIDTWHVYGQLKRELAKFSKITNKYIILHDTTVDEIYGETIRNGWNATVQSFQTGIPIDEINCGLGRAVDEFLATNKNWMLKEKFTNNNGLTILERIA
jgi:hypothetical protein